MTKSSIPVAYAPIKIDIDVEQSNNANEAQPHMKCHRSVGSRDKNHWTRKLGKKKDGPSEYTKTPKESSNTIFASLIEEANRVLENFEKWKDLNKLCHKQSTMELKRSQSWWFFCINYRANCDK